MKILKNHSIVPFLQYRANLGRKYSKIEEISTKWFCKQLENFFRFMTQCLATPGNRNGNIIRSFESENDNDSTPRDFWNFRSVTHVALSLLSHSLDPSWVGRSPGRTFRAKLENFKIISTEPSSDVTTTNQNQLINNFFQSF